MGGDARGLSARLGCGGESVEEAFPEVAVGVPATEEVDAGEGGGAHVGAEEGVFGELGEAGGDGGGVADGDDEALDGV